MGGALSTVAGRDGEAVSGDEDGRRAEYCRWLKRQTCHNDEDVRRAEYGCWPSVSGDENGRRAEYGRWLTNRSAVMRMGGALSTVNG